MSIDNINNNNYSFLNPVTETTEKKDQGALATEDFLALMTAELQNQDPLKPLENGDFLEQIASFSTVSGIGDLNNSFSNVAQSLQSGQALQASALVGREVSTPSALAEVTTGGGINAKINVDTPVSDLTVQIYNEQGVPIRTISMGSAAGTVDFSWDGRDESGQAVASGLYQYNATGTVGQQRTAFETETIARVDSVVVGSGSQGLTVNLSGIGAVPFSDVKEIK